MKRALRFLLIILRCYVQSYFNYHLIAFLTLLLLLDLGVASPLLLFATGGIIFLLPFNGFLGLIIVSPIISSLLFDKTFTGFNLPFVRPPFKLRPDNCLPTLGNFVEILFPKTFSSSNESYHLRSKECNIVFFS